jgi:hypothetical protein
VAPVSAPAKNRIILHHVVPASVPAAQHRFNTKNKKQCFIVFFELCNLTSFQMWNQFQYLPRMHFSFKLFPPYGRNKENRNLNTRNWKLNNSNVYIRELNNKVTRRRNLMQAIFSPKKVKSLWCNWPKIFKKLS